MPVNHENSCHASDVIFRSAIVFIVYLFCLLYRCPICLAVRFVVSHPSLSIDFSIARFVGLMVCSLFGQIGSNSVYYFLFLFVFVVALTQSGSCVFLLSFFVYLHKTISWLLWLLSDIICYGIFGYYGYCSKAIFFKITVIFCFYLAVYCFVVCGYGNGYCRYYRYQGNGYYRLLFVLFLRLCVFCGVVFHTVTLDTCGP